MSTKKSTNIKVAVIGAGHWGRNIVRNMRELDALGMICEADTERASWFSSEYPEIGVTSTIGSVLEDSAIRAVAIATPAVTHGELVKLSLEAGKDVFVEKPLCLDVREAQSLKALAENRGLILMVGHLLLYHPAFEALQRAVAGDELGTLRYIYSNRASLGKIRREENALWSFAPHDISMMLQLAGRLPERVIASGGQYLTQGVADTTLTHLDFGGGLQGHIFVSWLHPYKDHRMVVVGEKAMAVFNDVELGEGKLIIYRHKAHWEGNLPVIGKAIAEPIAYADDEPLRRECEAFLKAIRDRKAPPSTAAEGVRVLQVLEACDRALRTAEPVGLGKTAAA